VPVVHIWYLRSIPSKISYLLGYTTKQLEQIVYFEKFVILHPGVSGREYGELLEEEEYLKLDIEFGIDAASEIAEIAYKCSDIYHPEDEQGIRWNDSDIGIEWPGTEPVLSERDINLPMLHSLNLNQDYFFEEENSDK